MTSDWCKRRLNNEEEEENKCLVVFVSKGFPHNIQCPYVDDGLCVAFMVYLCMFYMSLMYVDAHVIRKRNRIGKAKD